MTVTLHANTELVAVSWVSEVLGTSDMVGTTLPQDNTTWAASGFAQITAMGGGRDHEVPMIYPVVSIDCWAVRPSSNKPPWGKAANIVETITRAALFARPHPLSLPGNYPDVQFFTAQIVSEPRRIPDLASYARFNFHINLFWAPVSV